MASRIDRDRARNYKKCTAFDHVANSLNKDRLKKVKFNYYIPWIDLLRGMSLTAWEMEFIGSIEKQMKTHGNVSAKQAVIFDQMLERYDLKQEVTGKSR